jgi:hypothetical protein
MAIKIQINSLEALERLIGGDSQLELEIRNNIVQEFSKKHLKPIAEQLDSRLESTATAVYNEVVEKRFGRASGYGYGKTYQLNSDIREAINQEVAVSIKQAVGDSIKDQVENINLEKMIQKAIDHKFNVQVNDMVNEMVRERIANIIKGLKE